MKNTVLHGRLEVISRQPLVIYDASHNPQKVGALADTLKDLLPDRKFIFVMGVLAEKDFRGMIGLTAGLAECYVTVTPPYARTAPMDSGALKTEIEKQFCDVENGGDVRTGLQKALARQEISGSPICCFGSFYSAKPIYEFFGEGRV